MAPDPPSLFANSFVAASQVCVPLLEAKVGVRGMLTRGPSCHHCQCFFSRKFQDMDGTVEARRSLWYHSYWNELCRHVPAVLMFFQFWQVLPSVKHILYKSLNHQRGSHQLGQVSWFIKESYPHQLVERIRRSWWLKILDPSYPIITPLITSYLCQLLNQKKHWEVPACQNLKN